jgi:hypothetical protein
MCSVSLRGHGKSHDTSDGINAPALRLRANYAVLVESS